MAEEKKPSKSAEFFFKHGEKVALIACVLALVAYFILGFAMAQEDTSGRDLDKEIRRVETEIRKPHDDKKAPAAKTWGSEARQPWEKVIDVNPPKNDWAGALATEIKHKPFKKVPPPMRGVKVPSVAMGGVDVALDGVKLSWSTTGFTAADMAKDRATTDFVKVSHFKVEREVTGTDKWTVLEEKLPPPPPPKGSKDIVPINMTYTDTKIEPKTKYSYRVTAYLDVEEIKKLDPKKTNLGGLDTKEGKLEAIATASPATTLGIWRLRFINMMKGQAYIEIEKFDRQHGKQKIAHIHYAGDRIGWWKKDPQDDKEEPSSVHAVSAGIKRIEVDFNTGMVLKSVEPKKVPVQVTRCTIKYDDTGKQLPHEPALEKVQIDTIEVVYTDEDGKEQTLYHPDPKTAAASRSRPCSEHGGGRAEPEAPKEGPKKDEPKEDPKVAAAKAREAEADKLFQEAVKAEQRGDKSGAISRFEKLLKDYKDTEYVSKGKKGIIEDKLKALK